MADSLRRLTTGSSGNGMMTGMSSTDSDRAMPSSQTPQLSLGGHGFWLANSTVYANGYRVWKWISLVGPWKAKIRALE